MLAVYGVDVLDPTVSLRRIHVLASRLPPGSLPAVENVVAWSTEAHLVARLNDALDMLTWVTLRVNGSKARKPKPLPRPGAKKADTPKMAWSDLAKALSPEVVNVNGR